MKKKVIFASIASICVLSALGFVSAILISDYVSLGANDNPFTYSLSFDSKNNKFTGEIGISSVYTQNGNRIMFSYDGFSSSESGWHKIINRGGFGNDDPLNGLKKIVVDFAAADDEKILISYGFGGDIIAQNEVSSGEVYSFNNQSPSYFKITNLSGDDLDIESIKIDYSCIESPDSHQEGTFSARANGKIFEIDVKSLTETNLKMAYEYAVSLKEKALYDFEKISINLPSGNLYLSETLNFAGYRNNSTPIIIQGDDTEIFGGSELPKGEWVHHADGIYKMNIGAGLDKFSALIVNGDSATVARTPDATFNFSYDNRTIYIDRDKLDLTGVSGSSELVTLERWAENIAVVKDIELKTRETGALFWKKTYYEFFLNLDDNGIKNFYESSRSYRPTSTTEISGFLQGNLSYLDEINEWHYDSKTGYLYYKPANPSTINEDTFIIPKLETILNTDGMEKDITIKGITFNGSNFASPLVNGFSEHQTNYYQDFAKNENKIISGMIEVSSTDVTFEECKFKNSSNIAVKINPSSNDVNLINNEIVSSGASSIYIGSPFENIYIDVPTNINIFGNKIDKFGTIFQGGSAICALYVDGLDIIKNSITNGAYSGITAGWGWTTDQSKCGHNHYNISHNFISNVMNSFFHDGGGIYVLGNFPNQLNEICNEMSYNYIEVSNQLNGALYLDEGSSGWDVHDNAVDITTGSTMHGVVMMHDPNNESNGVSQFANHITNNYYRGGAVNGSDGVSQLSYVPGSGYYTGDDLANYNNKRNIVFETPIESNETHVKNYIYDSCFEDDATYPLASASLLEKCFYGISDITTDYSSLMATFSVSSSGFNIRHEYLNRLVDGGYHSLSLTMSARKNGGDYDIGSVVYYATGSLQWNEYYGGIPLVEDEEKTITLSLDLFKKFGSEIHITFRDEKGIGADNNIPSNVVLSGLSASRKIIHPNLSVNSGSLELIDSGDDYFTYSAKNITYNWARITLSNESMAMERSRGYSSVIIMIKGNIHNMYVFHDTVDYARCIKSGGGKTSISLDLSQENINIMTSREHPSIGQDDSGIYGTTENFTITIKLLKEYATPNIFASKSDFRSVFSELNVSNITSNDATIGFNGYRARINNGFIKKFIDSGAKSFEFDIVIPDGCDVKTVVTCFFKGPKNTNVLYDEAGVFKINSNNVIHIKFDASFIKDVYDIQLVSRDANGYGGNDVALANATIKNFAISY